MKNYQHFPISHLVLIVPTSLLFIYNTKAEKELVYKHFLQKL